MRTKLLGAFCLLFPLLSVAADIQRITPITSDNSVKIELSAHRIKRSYATFQKNISLIIKPIRQLYWLQIN